MQRILTLRACKSYRRMSGADLKASPQKQVCLQSGKTKELVEMEDFLELLDRYLWLQKNTEDDAWQPA